MEGEAEPGDKGVEIDPSELSADALRGIVEEFVTREGTDYGTGDSASADGGQDDSGEREHIWSLDEKVDQVLDQIQRKEARIVFDLETETVGIVSADTRS